MPTALKEKAIGNSFFRRIQWNLPHSQSLQPLPLNQTGHDAVVLHRSQMSETGNNCAFREDGEGNHSFSFGMTRMVHKGHRSVSL
jgi:hypothetical protein